MKGKITHAITRRIEPGDRFPVGNNTTQVPHQVVEVSLTVDKVLERDEMGTVAYTTIEGSLDLYVLDLSGEMMGTVQ